MVAMTKNISDNIFKIRKQFLCKFRSSKPLIIANGDLTRNYLVIFGTPGRCKYDFDFVSILFICVFILSCLFWGVFFFPIKMNGYEELLSLVTIVRSLLSIDVLKMLYFSLVYCHLKHCIVSWGTGHS